MENTKNLEYFKALGKVGICLGDGLIFPPVYTMCITKQSFENFLFCTFIFFFSFSLTHHHSIWSAA